MSLTREVETSERRVVASIGGIEEARAWAVEFGYETFRYEKPPEPPCPHAKFLGLMTEYSGGSRWEIPRTVHATNEGGYSSTVVCLDCILEFVDSAEFKGLLEQGNPVA